MSRSEVLRKVSFSMEKGHVHESGVPTEKEGNKSEHITPFSYLIALSKWHRDTMASDRLVFIECTSHPGIVYFDLRKAPHWARSVLGIKMGCWSCCQRAIEWSMPVGVCAEPFGGRGGEGPQRHCRVPALHTGDHLRVIAPCVKAWRQLSSGVFTNPFR